MKTASTPAQSAVQIRPAYRFWEISSLTLIAAACVLTVVGAASPEVFYDSLVYHLALPQLYLLRHRIIPTSYNIYSGTPLGIQMLYGWALALSGNRLTSLLRPE